MDIKMWMREALDTGAFASVEHVTARELARAARVGLRLGRTEARTTVVCAEEVLAEPRPPGHCAQCAAVLPGERRRLCASCRLLAFDTAMPRLLHGQTDDPLLQGYRLLVRIAANAERCRRGEPELP